MKDTIPIPKIVFFLTLLSVSLCLEEASGWPWSRKGGDVPFPEAPEDLQPALREMAQGRCGKAMGDFWAFLAERQGHEHGYSVAQWSLADCARSLGLKQLATEIYADIVRSSMDREITLRALEGLKGITQEDVYDERMIVEELLYEQEFGALPQDLNNFVHYHKALMDFRNGYPRWASHHMKQIQGQDDYFYRGKILEALWALKGNDLEGCRIRLEEVAGDRGASRQVRNEAKKALARVLYEQGEFVDAYRLYREIEAPEVSLADVILEQAWAKYRQGDSRKAMGLLVAFDAPTFRHLFKPEQYLLKSLIYMQVCHYGAARDALGAFQDRYGDILTCIAQRGDLAQNPHARAVLAGLPRIQRIDAYLRELEREAALLEARSSSKTFVEAVRPLYGLKKAEVERQRERVWNLEAERMKRALFAYQEQANLLVYESGMHQHQKVKQMYYAEDRRSRGGSAGKTVPRFSKNTYYAFRGEFWSDELDDYTFLIEDYCDLPEKWTGKEATGERK